MAYIMGEDRNQITLFPQVVADYTLDWEDGQEVIICIKEIR